MLTSMKMEYLFSFNVSINLSKPILCVETKINLCLKRKRLTNEKVYNLFCLLKVAVGKTIIRLGRFEKRTNQINKRNEDF